MNTSSKRYIDAILNLLRVSGKALMTKDIVDVLRCSRTTVSATMRWLEEAGMAVTETYGLRQRAIGLRGQSFDHCRAYAENRVNETRERAGNASKAASKRMAEVMNEPHGTVIRKKQENGTTLVRFGRSYKSGHGQLIKPSHRYASGLTYIQN